ncbi:SRPBCC family protein [Corallococcus llansteffanensis]|uniref:SRPBCC domain-containing protein n=1 Tax=Corallococcus llansteffanensis TaxID=2316731 RepID=A0A3A8PWD1_9BACT|nr:SRPBCC family protein [Corallococcus llansteffanensis]RKH59340.1 SRPBCC domain-containing protein [Corallococcus llansteffanensis]
MTSPAPIQVRVTHRFKASAERVFDAWLDPEKARQWLFTTRATPLVRAEIDARVGGIFRLSDLRDGEEVEHTGKYLELDRPRRLVFTFGVPKYSPDYDRVTVDIVALDSGCEVTLTHEMSPNAEQYRDGAQKEWARLLGNFDALLGGDSRFVPHG